MTIEVILPCLDEAESLPGVLAALPDGFSALVVDNGSRDGTPDIARLHGARVVHEPRRGYGAAAHAGLENATTEFVATLDADGSLDPAVLPELADAVRSGRAELAVGRRVPEAGAQPWHTRLGNAFLAERLRRHGVPVHDIAPIRLGRRSALLDLDIADRAFGYPLELLIKAAERGWRIHEMDVAYRVRTGGRSKVSGSIRGTVRAARDMTKVLYR